MSLARAFIAAGVPAVLGVLTPIEDPVAARAFTTFHRLLATGLSPLDAVRSIQLELLESSDTAVHDPLVWGAFELIGGSAVQHL
jgi:CHAT domain-containing protein